MKLKRKDTWYFRSCTAPRAPVSDCFDVCPRRKRWTQSWRSGKFTVWLLLPYSFSISRLHQVNWFLLWGPGYGGSHQNSRWPSWVHDEGWRNGALWDDTLILQIFSDNDLLQTPETSTWSHLIAVMGVLRTTRRIHGTGIFTYIYHANPSNHMGNGSYNHM